MTRKDFCFVLFFFGGGGGGNKFKKTSFNNPTLYGRARNSAALGMLYSRFLIIDDEVFCY